MRCPSCGAEAYVGLFNIDCPTLGCSNNKTRPVIASDCSYCQSTGCPNPECSKYSQTILHEYAVSKLRNWDTISIFTDSLLDKFHKELAGDAIVKFSFEDVYFYVHY